MKRVSLLAVLAVSVSLVVGCAAAPELSEGDEEGNEPGGNASIDPDADGAEVVGTATQALTINFVICTGGYAPVRYFNTSCANGTIYDYYPQGMHGWAQTAGGCSSGGVDWYFHPNNGQHGGWIEAWRLCEY
jgi:hypothetical protein